MSVDVHTQITIDRPIEHVASFAADPTHAPEWYAKIESVEWKTPPPLEIGSQVAFVAHFLGRRLSYTYEMIDYRPGELLMMRTASGPFPMETTYRWSASGPDATVMSLRNQGEPAGFSRIARPIMAMAMRRANRKDLRQLKRLLESCV